MYDDQMIVKFSRFSRIFRFFFQISVLLTSLNFFSSCAPDSTGSSVTFDATFSGIISDASTGDPIQGATVYAEGYSVSTTTDATGSYTLSNAPAGERVYLKAVASGFEEGTLIKSGISGQTTSNANFSLLPNGFGDNKIVIILSWAAAPPDLDSHLFVGNGAQTLIDHTAKGDNDGVLDSAPFAGLDVDDTDGEGPETMVIRFVNGSTDYSGTYRYYIHDFQNTGNLPSSEAVVTIYIDGTFTESFDIPSGTNENFWHVFDMDQNGQITSVNTLIESNEPTAP